HQCRGTSSLREESSSSSEEHSSKAKKDAPSARPNPPSTDPALDNVIARTGATIEEAEHLLESVDAHAERNSNPSAHIDRHVARAADRHMRRHLKAVRAQRAPQARTGTPVPRTRTVCALHGIQGACPACRTELNLGGAMAQAVIDMYTNLGPDRDKLRPDLA